MRSVLIVDDDHNSINYVRDLLKGERFLVNSISDSMNLERELSMIHYNCIILDLYMPERDGLETLHLIRKLSPFTKVIMITVEDLYLNTAYMLGVDAYLIKGQYTKEELLSHLN